MVPIDKLVQTGSEKMQIDFLNTQDANAIRLMDLVREALKIVQVSVFFDMCMAQVDASTALAIDQKLGIKLAAQQFRNMYPDDPNLANMFSYVLYGGWETVGASGVLALTNEQRAGWAVMIGEIARYVIGTEVTRLAALVQDAVAPPVDWEIVVDSPPTGGEGEGSPA